MFVLKKLLSSSFPLKENYFCRELHNFELLIIFFSLHKFSVSLPGAAADKEDPALFEVLGRNVGSREQSPVKTVNESSQILDIESHLIESLPEAQSRRHTNSCSGVDIEELPPAEDELAKNSQVESETSPKTVIEVEPAVPKILQSVEVQLEQHNIGVATIILDNELGSCSKEQLEAPGLVNQLIKTNKKFETNVDENSNTTHKQEVNEEEADDIKKGSLAEGIVKEDTIQTKDIKGASLTEDITQFEVITGVSSAEGIEKEKVEDTVQTEDKTGVSLAKDIENAADTVETKDIKGVSLAEDIEKERSAVVEEKIEAEDTKQAEVKGSSVTEGVEKEKASVEDTLQSEGIKETSFAEDIEKEKIVVEDNTQATNIKETSFEDTPQSEVIKEVSFAEDIEKEKVEANNLAEDKKVIIVEKVEETEDIKEALVSEDINNIEEKEVKPSDINNIEKKEEKPLEDTKVEQLSIDINGLPLPSTPLEEEEKKRFLDSIPHLSSDSDSVTVSKQAKKEYYKSLRKYLIHEEENKPPVPLQTYRWEDLRRAREKVSAIKFVYFYDIWVFY